VEAAQVTVRTIPHWRSKYFHLAMRRGRKIAKVAMARKLAVGLFWMMRQEWNYEQVRGTARKSPWCAREHRAIDWGIPLLLTEEFEVVIMIAVATEEMHGSDRF